MHNSRLKILKFLLLTLTVLSSCIEKPKEINDSWNEISTDKEKINISAFDLNHPLKKKWWLIFNEPKLNQLEEKLLKSNLSIAAAKANLEQAKAVTAQARAALFPVLNASLGMNRQNSSPSNGGSSTGRISGLNYAQFNLYGSFEPDFFGQFNKTIASNEANLAANEALVAATQLSQEILLAQYYFEIENLDADQEVLDALVQNQQALLHLTQNNYQAGVAAQDAVISAKTNLSNASAKALDNQILRHQDEHAIAILVGMSPDSLKIACHPLKQNPPALPTSIPSTLLKQRPDIIEAKNLLQSAALNIGIAKTAYFPKITFNSSGANTTARLAELAANPLNFWALGVDALETLYDGGLRTAKVAAAQAAYQEQLASYRLTVLNALQSVEDGLSAKRILAQEKNKLKQAVQSNQAILLRIRHQYQAGTIAKSTVINAKINWLNAEKNLYDVIGRELATTLSFIKALGGGYQAT